MNCNELKLKSFAKINLFLTIKEKLNNGYHSLETILQTIDLYDEIMIKKTKIPGIQIQCNHSEVPIGPNSPVYQAAKALLSDDQQGIEMVIHKKIPISAGLGGGSSNIAMILLGVNKLLDFGLNRVKLKKMAEKFGMDTPFFIDGGTMYATGRGEKLYRLPSIDPPIDLVLVNPGFRISTKWAYETFDKYRKQENEKIFTHLSPYFYGEERICLRDIKNLLYNHFEDFIGIEFPVISQIKKSLSQQGAIKSLLSGSGPTVFGIFSNREQAQKAFLRMKNDYPYVFLTRTIKGKNIF